MQMTLSRIQKTIVIFASLACSLIALANPGWISDPIAIALFVLAAIGLVVATSSSSRARHSAYGDQPRS